LESIGLMGTDGETEFDRISALAARCLAAPVGLVSLVGEDCQVFVGVAGLTTTRCTPLSHTFCPHVVTTAAPLVIADVSQHPLVAENPASPELSVGAYLGFPLATQEGLVLGAFCVMDYQPRQWSEIEISLIAELTAVILDLLESRMATVRSRSHLDQVIHDLKTPLAGITMATGLLMERRDEIPTNLHPLVEVLTESSEKALQLIRTLSETPPRAGRTDFAKPAPS
jgi:GAF domain-containing protein